jgi:hypothetical protein
MSVVLQIVKIYESCQPVGAWDRREPEGRMHDGKVVFYFKSQCTTLSKIGNNFAPKLVKLKASRVSAYGFRIGTSPLCKRQILSTVL